MKSLIPQRTFWAALLVSILFLVITATAPAQDHPTCTTWGAVGAWGYTEAGTIVLPTGGVPFAAAGRVAFDKDGNVSGTQTSSLGGRTGQDVIRGTYSLNPDCTGTMTVGVYDQSGTLLRTIGLAFVIDDNATETRAVVTSLVLPNGAGLPAIITLEGRRILPREHRALGGFGQ